MSAAPADPVKVFWDWLWDHCAQAQAAADEQRRKEAEDRLLAMSSPSTSLH